MDEKASQGQVKSLADNLASWRQLLRDAIQNLNTRQVEDRKWANTFQNQTPVASGAILTTLAYSYDIGTLYLFASQLLDIVALQAGLNDELMKRVKGMENERTNFKLELSKGIGEAVKDAIDNLEKQAKEQSPKHLYG